MCLMNFEKINVGAYTFLKSEFKNANFIFSTGENHLNFNKNIDEGKENLNNIKKWFFIRGSMLFRSSTQ